MKRVIILLLCAILALTMAFSVQAEEAPVETPVEGEADPSFTETIVTYVQEHFEEISVIATLLLTVIYELRKHKVLNGSIGTLNNNAVTIAESSAHSIQNIADSMQLYKADMESMLTGIRRKYEESANAEDLLTEVKKLLTTSKLAMVELANEVAELLVLANIPNSKKDELYARHLAAVRALADAEQEGDTNDSAEA